MACVNHGHKCLNMFVCWECWPTVGCIGYQLHVLRVILADVKKTSAQPKSAPANKRQGTDGAEPDEAKVPKKRAPKKKA